MKILMVNDYKGTVGGTETYMYTLITALENEGNIVKLFTARNQVGNDNYYFKLLKRIFNVGSLLKFRKEISSFKPDIIHIHGIFNELTPSILLATRGIPVVMTVHNNQIVNAVSILSGRTGKECKSRICPGCRNCVGLKGAIYEYFKRKIHKHLLKKINLYITPSKYMKELIEEAGFSPVTHIPNGFKLMPYSPITNWDRLLYVGRLTREKGVEYLIKAIPDVIKAHPTVKLDIVGNGDLKDVLMDIVSQLHIENNVFFHTDVSHDKVQEFYKNTTLVVVPSIYHDNFPTVCIEAMSVGRPIIGTKMGGIPELIDDGVTGLLVEPKNAEQIAHAIISSSSNENQLNKISLIAYEISENYSIKLHGDVIRMKYTELVSLMNN